MPQKLHTAPFLPPSLPPSLHILGHSPFATPTHRSTPKPCGLCPSSLQEAAPLRLLQQCCTSQWCIAASVHKASCQEGGGGRRASADKLPQGTCTDDDDQDLDLQSLRSLWYAAVTVLSRSVVNNHCRDLHMHRWSAFLRSPR